MNYQLIQVSTKDGLKLNGLFNPGEKTKSACILIHGFTADFYSHQFYHSITQKLQEQSNAIVLAQTRGTGLHTEFLKTDGEEIFVGSFYEKLEDAQLDISAYVEFLLKEGYQDIVLMGHSLGTIKVIRYLFEGEHKDTIKKIVLLAPFDKNVFMEIKAPGKWLEFLEKAKEKISSGEGENIVPLPEYEDFPMTYNTFYSWYEQSDLNKIWDFYKKEYISPVLQKITIPVKVILGENDVFVNYPQFDETAESVLNSIKKQISDCETTLIKGANHTYVGYEEQVGNEVAIFV